MANDYVTVDDFYNIVQLDPEKYGTIMQFMLDTAANHINNVTKRKKDGFLADSVASARLFYGNNKQIIEIDEAVEITALGFKYHYDDATYTPMLTTDYIAFSGSNDSPNFNNTPYTKLMINPNGDFEYFPEVISHSGGYWSNKTSSNFPVYPNIQITGKWGYATTVPEIIKHCVIIQATRYVKRAQGAYGDAIGNTETGQMFFTRKMDNDISSMLKDGGMIRVSNGIGSKR